MLTFAMPLGHNSCFIPCPDASRYPRAARGQERKPLTHYFQQLAHSFLRSLPKSENQLLCFHAPAHDFVEIGGLRGEIVPNAQRLLEMCKHLRRALCFGYQDYENLIVPFLNPEAAERVH